MNLPRFPVDWQSQHFRACLPDSRPIQRVSSDLLQSTGNRKPREAGLQITESRKSEDVTIKTLARSGIGLKSFCAARIRPAGVV